MDPFLISRGNDLWMKYDHMNWRFIWDRHCVESVCIRSFSGPYSPAFGLNTPYLSVFSPNVGKCGPENLFTQWSFCKFQPLTYFRPMFSLFYTVENNRNPKVKPKPNENPNGLKRASVSDVLKKYYFEIQHYHKRL